MSKIFWKSLLVSPAILGTALLVSTSANAAESLTTKEVVQTTTNEIAQVQNNAPAAKGDSNNVLNQINNYSEEGQANSVSQLNNVFQLRDVSPGDWAFEALRNLVERYGCIAGYPDSTFRGNRAMTRYEFAAGLNACLQQIERLIGTGSTSPDTGDMQKIQRLVQEFQGELATLGARVDNLEGRVGTLEANQFSTTTKLKGEVIFALSDTFGDKDPTKTVFGDRVRLALNTSFTGKDNLVTRLAAGNLGSFSSAGTAFDAGAEDTQTFNLGNTGGNAVKVDWLAYYFPFGASKVYVAATGGIHSDYAPTTNPYFEDYDGGNGALSSFASENPIYRIGGGTGAGVTFALTPLKKVLPTSVSLGYLAGSGTSSDPANPSSGNGLFNGDYAALGQVNMSLGDRFGLGLTYVHGYHTPGSAIFDLGGDGGVVGTAPANQPFSATTRMISNSYGVEAAFRLSEKISISGFGSLTNVIGLKTGSSDIWTYGLGVALPDFGKEGNLLGIFAGAQPYNADVAGHKLPIHVEGFYKYKLSDNISITPGVIWLTNPNQDGDNKDAFIGTLRTTFTF